MYKILINVYRKIVQGAHVRVINSTASMGKCIGGIGVICLRTPYCKIKKKRKNLSDFWETLYRIGSSSTYVHTLIKYTFVGKEPKQRITGKGLKI